MTDTAQARSLSVRVVLTVGIGLVVPSLPAFLIGATAAQVRDDLGVSEVVLGAAVAVLYIAGAAAAPFTGILADRRGARTSIALGSMVSAGAMTGIALFAERWGGLMILMACAGVGIALVDPGLTRLVAGSVPAGRRGMVFGIKEASIPLATMVAGFAVPTIAVTVGWRWVFAVGLVPFAAVMLLLATAGPSPRDAAPAAAVGSGPQHSPGRTATLALALGAALASMAATGISVFLTDSAVSAGLSQSYGGFLLGVASVVGVVVRIASGMLADRRPEAATALMPWMLVAGSVTMLLGATGTAVLLEVGAVGAIAGGWGWTALFFLTLVRADPLRPGAVAGIGLSGLAIGNALGPIVFGALAQSVSYSAAWVLAAAAAASAAGAMYAGGRLLAVPSS
ncbi:putative MFS family arabinose efflux permease [Haloactinopolyspora alba]|uniref:Putative MFS family arabinose efflux permease n=1 Tax=Haloactinopolyspora alba TaxID=648780 RepID=A0A2P8DVP5_9ACTN|nr:MFS transporter [Haloactinopolyspora alba]PSL01275.1 putative MFS family arabinose efflux permease [Haloactinopolyspora alba]